MYSPYSLIVNLHVYLLCANFLCFSCVDLFILITICEVATTYYHLYPLAVVGEVMYLAVAQS